MLRNRSLPYDVILVATELKFEGNVLSLMASAFNSAAIFLPGHPYIESTTVLSDTTFLPH